MMPCLLIVIAALSEPSPGRRCARSSYHLRWGPRESTVGGRAELSMVGWRYVLFARRRSRSVRSRTSRRLVSISK